MKFPQLNFPHVQQNTLAQLLYLSLSGEEMSRSEWAKQAHVGLTTAGKVAQALLEAGVVTERFPPSFASGRKKGLLKTTSHCRFLVASVNERGCHLTVTDGWGQKAEQSRLLPNADLTEGENMLLYREAIARWKSYLEEAYPLVGSMLTLPKEKMNDTKRNHFFSAWDVDFVLSQESCVRDMILDQYREKTVYYLSLDTDLYPVLYAKNKEIPCTPIPTQDFKSREAQLQKVIKGWYILREMLPDPEMILWAKEPSPQDEELLNKKLLARTSNRVTYCTDLEMRGALHCLKKKIAESFSSTI